MDLNILLRGQSNPIFFDRFGGLAALRTDVQALLGFDGVHDKVNLLGGEATDAEGWATTFGGTALLPPSQYHWLNLVNNDWTQGFTPGAYEQSTLTYIGDLTPEVRAAPTAVLFMQDESDAAAADTETTDEWSAAVRYEAGLVRDAFGQGAASVPYLFVPVPTDSDDAATMQAIRLGQEQLSADPAFNASVATHTGDVDMDNPYNGLPAGDVIFGGPHLNQVDVAMLAARIAPSVADEFAQYALPGSPVANGHVDDSGPQAIRVDWVRNTPTQIIITLQNDPSSQGLASLGSAASAGLGWTIRDGDNTVSAISAQLLPGDQVLVAFAAPVTTDSAARLFYNYGTGRLAFGADTHTGAGYPGNGIGSPGSGNGIYDDNGLPVWSTAAGLPINIKPTAAVVASGEVSSGLSLYNGDTLEVRDGGAVHDALVLTGGAVFADSGASVGNLVIDGGSVIIYDGAWVMGSFQDAGSLTLMTANAAAADATFSGNGTLSVSGGGSLALRLGREFSGSLQIQNSTLTLAAGSDTSAATVTFNGGGNLVLDGVSSGNTVYGMAAGGGQTVEVEGLSERPVVSRSGDEVTVTAGDITVTLDLVGSADTTLGTTDAGGVYDADYAAGIPPTEYSVFLTETALPCYCAGTLITTSNGDVPVETLQVGDKVVTVAGSTKAIRWIGRRTIAPRSASTTKDRLPIRIAAGALSRDVPQRDLFVSPCHALLLQGVLVPAGQLVNGLTITQVRPAGSLQYIHFELDEHDVILAEGAAAETFYDEGHRATFGIGEGTPANLYSTSGYYASRVTQGDILERIRAVLNERATSLEMAD